MENVGCRDLHQSVLKRRNLIIASNRGPFSLQATEEGEPKFQRSGGGLVTALLGLARQVQTTWVASAMNDEERGWKECEVPLGSEGENIRIHFVAPEAAAYDAFYGVISNPLLWFLQHSIWDFANAPTINQATWQAWDEGYKAVNQQFADAVVDEIRRSRQPALVMLQDYHLYLAPRLIRQRLRSRPIRTLLTHFVHIPWPGPEDWGLLPKRMRESILDGLCAVDLVGFQTRGDSLNFMRTCETLLPNARVSYRSGRVMLHNHITHVRDFPISIDVEDVQSQARTEEVQQFKAQLAEGFGDYKIILRIDRTEPSKNIVRGFQAYEELLDNHPEHRGCVQFVAILVPSRLEVEQYQEYLSSVMTTTGRINAKYGTSEWEPVRLLVGESYPRALAAMQLYDVLLVNPVADGMNLVAKEGPSLNKKSGVVILSERAGAHQQLGPNALVIAPCDVSATADAMHEALLMPLPERQRRATELRESIMNEDIHRWLCWQLDALEGLINYSGEVHRRENL